MPTPLTGNARLQGDKWYARVTIARNQRVTFDLPTCRKQDEDKARARAQLLGVLGKRMREARLDVELATDFLRRAAGVDSPALDTVTKAIDMMCRGEAAPRIQATVTVKEFGEQWTSGELHRRYPDNVKKKKSSQDDAERLRLYVYPVVGDLPLAQFRVDHGHLVMKGLPPRLSRSTRRHVAQALARLLKLAAYPAMLIPASPLPAGFLPPPGPRKALSFLYPDEERALLGAQAVPLAYRIAYGFLTREGMRRSEASTLTWAQLDLERGAVSLDENKTDDPRAWALDPSVARALVAWRSMRRRRPKPSDPVFVDEEGRSVIDRGDGKGCDRLREHLRVAGVDRAELFEQSEVRQRIRMHDLRATFITINLANGKTESWIADRTGHTSSEMINRYRRAARRVSELGLGELAPLDEAIPELPRTTPEPPAGGPTGGPEGTPETPSDPGADQGDRDQGTSSEPSQSVATGDQTPIFSNAIAEAGFEPAPPFGERILNPSGEVRNSAISRDLGGSVVPDATDRDESILIEAASALIPGGSAEPPRARLGRVLGVLAGELVAAGDLYAARVAHEALGRLIDAPAAAPGDTRAEVVDLAERRRREDR